MKTAPTSGKISVLPRITGRRAVESPVQQVGPNRLTVDLGRSRPGVALALIGLSVAAVLAIFYVDYVPFVEDQTGFRILMGLLSPIAFVLGLAFIGSTGATIEMIEEFGFTPEAAAWKRSADAGRVPDREMRQAAIAVRTDFQRMKLGKRLRHSEQVWLHDALRFLLTGVETYADAR